MQLNGPELKSIVLGGKKMKLRKLGAALGAATLVGLRAFRWKHKNQEHKKWALRPDHMTLCSSLLTAGLALWELKKHHHAAT